MRAPVALLLPTLLLAACGNAVAPGSGGSPTSAPPATSTTAPSPAPTTPGGDMDDMEEQAARTQAFADTLVGMKETEAITAMESATPPYAYRVVERDGESFPVTMDYSPTRINLSITAGVVTKATVG